MKYSRSNLDRLDPISYATPIPWALILDGEPHRGLTRCRPTDARAMIPNKMPRIEITGVEAERKPAEVKQNALVQAR